MARILLWSTAFWPMIGGVEVLGAKLAVALADRGHTMRVITDRPENLARHDSFEGVQIDRLPMTHCVSSKNIEQWIWTRREVARIKQEFRPDLVWDYLLSIDSMFHLMTETAFPAPTLVTVHGEFPAVMLGESSAVRSVLERAVWVTACSQHTLDATRNQVPEISARSSVIFNGLDMPPLTPSPLPFDEPRLLCVGRIGSVEEKGFDVAIDAMPSIVAKFPRARLVIVGDGAGRRELQAHAHATGAAEFVDFVGWLHPDKVATAMNAATIVLMPTRVPEGFGLVALQGQQMARPVVASRVGGVSEVVVDGETGILVPSDDASALAAAVVTLLRDPERARRMGAMGRVRAEREFSFDRYATCYDELLLSLTGSIAEAVV